MTDKPIETGEDLSLHDDFSPKDSSTETWQDELPPEDDFHDQDGEPEEVLDEMIEEASKHEGEASPKRGRGVLLGALGVGALVIGGLAYLQFGQTTKDEGQKLLSVSNVMNIKEIRKTPSPQENSAIKTEQVMEPVGKVDMTALFHQAQKKEGVGETTAFPVKEGEMAPAERPEAVEKSSGLLSSSDSENVGLPSLPPTSAPPVVMNAAQELKVETLPVKKEEIKALVLGGVTKDEGKAASMGVPQAVWEARLNEMTTKIESLKGELDHSLQQNAQLISQVETLKKTAALSQEPALKDTKQETASLLVDGKGDQAVSQKTRTKTPAKKVVKKKATSAPSPSWVLRAATPDAAWVASGPESQELRRVAVGETLRGLGKVKEIRQKGEKWEVIGEKGTLR